MKHRGRACRRPRSQGPAAAAPLRALVALSCAAAAAWAESAGFLVLTAPRNALVAWVQLPAEGDFTGLSPKTLIDEGLQHPQGICVDQKRKLLYVADPDQQKIFGYPLSIATGALAVVGDQTIVASGVESRWVAVDGSGNVFFSDEPQNRILKVSAHNALRGSSDPEVIYTGASSAEVNEPGGVAVDNLNVYWTNKQFGTDVGSLVRASASPTIVNGAGAAKLSVLAKNSVKSYGVCIAMGNIYFTDSEKNVYGVKKHGEQLLEVATGLDKPRGCAWDGDGTVYIADRGAGAVYSLASNMHILQKQEVKKALDFDDAFGLAVVKGSARAAARLGACATAVATALLSVMLMPPHA